MGNKRFHFTFTNDDDEEEGITVEIEECDGRCSIDINIPYDEVTWRDAERQLERRGYGDLSFEWED